MSMDPKFRCKLEKAIVLALIDECDKVGYRPFRVYDGSESLYTATAQRALDAIFAVDDSTVYFTDLHVREINWVKLVGGNGEDIISDYTCGDRVFESAVMAVMERIKDAKVVV